MTRWLPLLIIVPTRARQYTMAVPGCSNQTYDMTDLETIAQSQRGVWEELGTVVPWWSVLSAPEFDGTSQLSEDKMRAFYATGEHAIVKALVRTATIAKAHGTRAAWSGGGSGATAIDFGCGVGRLAQALARRFTNVVCVDHSTAHLTIAAKSITGREASRLHYVATSKAGFEIADARADFVLSLLSLQHMVPQVQVAVLEHLCDALNVGGLGRAQLLTGYTNSPYIERDCDWRLAVEERGMQLHFLPLMEATRHLSERGCLVLAEEPCDDHVSIPDRASTAHCVTFSKLGSGVS